MKKVIGIIGRIGAGKDTVSEYISKKYGFSVIAFRDAVKMATEAEGLIPNRENMQTIGTKNREKYGEDYYTKKIIEKSDKIENNIIIKEMRKDSDVLPLKEKFGDNIKIIEVTADEDKRFQRMFLRGRLGDPKDMKEFERQQAREEELGFTQALNHKDIELDNNGSFGELYERIDNLLKTMGHSE